MANLVREHDEQVAPAAAAQGPALIPVEMRLAPAGQEGVGQGAPCERHGRGTVSQNQGLPRADTRLLRGVCVSHFLTSLSSLIGTGVLGGEQMSKRS